MSNYSNILLGFLNLCFVHFQETKILWHVKRHFWRKCWSTLRKTIVLLKPQTFFQKVVANLKLMLLDWRWYKDWSANVTQHGCKLVHSMHVPSVNIAISVQCFFWIFFVFEKVIPTKRYAMLTKGLTYDGIKNIHVLKQSFLSITLS